MALAVMTRDVKKLSERLVFALELADMSQSQLARAVGVKQQTINKLVGGATKGSAHLYEIAQALNVNYQWLKTGNGDARPKLSTAIPASLVKKEHSLRARKLNTIRVTAAVQAGAWREALEWEPADQYELPVALPEQYRDIPVFGFEVHGPSMEKVYKHGTVVMAVRYIDLGREPGERERVVVQRTKSHLVEASVKTFRRDASGVPHLWPESNHPSFQAPLDLDPIEGEEIVITHKIIGSISFEP